MPNLRTTEETLRSPIDYSEVVRLATPGANWYAPLSSISRQKLVADRTYYVRTDGSDANTGLVNSAGGAFLTIQKAIDVVVQTIDFAGFTVTIIAVAGTFAAGGIIAGPISINRATGLPSLVIGGVGSTTIIAVTGDHGFVSSGYGTNVLIQNVKISTTTSGNCIRAIYGGQVFWQGVEFGSCAEVHVNAFSDGVALCAGNYSISGGGQAHLHASVMSKIVCNSVTVTISNTPAFSAFFAGAGELADVQSIGVTWSSSATGPRYTANLNAVINTSGGGASYFPGDSAGSTATGGQYA